MYTWTLDLYMWLIIFVFFVLPFFIFFLYRRKTKDIKKYKVILISFVLFIIFTLLLLVLREYHINTIFDICFDYTGYAYKEKTIPQGCYLFNRDKYMGVGWPLKAMFLVAYNFIYHIIISIIWNIVDFFKHK